MAAVKVKRRYPLHSVFLVYCFVSLLVAIGAFQQNNNLLFWLFGLSMSMLLVSGVVSGAMMMGLTVERRVIEEAAVGRPLRIGYAITNRNRLLPAFALTILERVEDAGENSAEQAGRLDQPPMGFAAHVPAGGTVIVESVCKPQQRGRVRLVGFNVVTAFPFGIIRKSLWHEAPASFIVRPEPAQLPPELFLQDRGHMGAGEMASMVGRAGDEVVGLREYAPGDPARIVSWRASARRTLPGDLVVKQHAEGSPRRLWVTLALSRAATPAESERAIQMAAAALRQAGTHGLVVGLAVRTDWGLRLETAPRWGAGRLGALLNDLALLPLPGVDAEAAGGNGELEVLPRIPSSDLLIVVDSMGNISARAAKRPRARVKGLEARP